jgi:hypothetical protein
MVGGSSLKTARKNVFLSDTAVTLNIHTFIEGAVEFSKVKGCVTDAFIEILYHSVYGVFARADVRTILNVLLTVHHSISV